MPQAHTRLFVALYTDEDITADLAAALRRRGYTAQSAVEAGKLGISDDAQLSYATEQDMAILTYNIKDFIRLAQIWRTSEREHAGIIISEQFSHPHFGELLWRVLRLLDTFTPDEIRNQVVFLQQFRR